MLRNLSAMSTFSTLSGLTASGASRRSSTPSSSKPELLWIREPRLDLPEAAVQLGLGVEALEGDLATDEFVRGCIGHDGVQAAAL